MKNIRLIGSKIRKDGVVVQKWMVIVDEKTVTFNTFAEMKEFFIKEGLAS